MFELANEPINILGPDGTYGAGSQGHFDKLKEYFQSVVNAMRAQGCGNILWIPGLGYQGLYKGFAVNPIEGDNIGYAVHLYRAGWEVMEKMGMVVPVREAMNLSRKDGMIP